MSVLSIIQSHCLKHALAKPTSVVGSTDTQSLQLLEVLSEVIDEITVEAKMQVTTLIATHTLTAAEDQGALSTLCPSGYVAANFETFYDRSLMRPLYGPLNDQEWQALMALPNPGPFYKFRILGDHLLINPVPTAPFSLIAWEYMSSWAVTDSGGTAKAGITADSDLCVFPENILKRGLSYRWKQIKGLPYQADEKRYWDLMNNYLARDAVKRELDMANGPPQALKPGIFVPAASWPV